VLGDALIGLATIHATRGGIVGVALPVFAPPIPVQVELLTLSPAPDPGDILPAAIARHRAGDHRTLRLRPAGPIGTWPVRVARAAGRTTITATGCAPLTFRALRLRLVSRDGRVLDRITSQVERDDAIPGASGGEAIGLGSFRATLTTTAEIDAVRIEIDWEDPPAAGWGTTVEEVDLAAEPGRAGP
jgi:hypothetical protein